MTAHAWRILTHALDRTGPPRLAVELARWLRRQHPEDRLDLVSLRGGPLEDTLGALCPVKVALDPEEGWDPSRPDPSRVAALRRRLDALPEVDATLAISVSAGAVLPFLADPRPLVTWVVEEEEDYLPDLVRRTDRWLAGSEGTRIDVLARLGIPGPGHPSAPPCVTVPEFLLPTPDPDPAAVTAARRSLAVQPDDLVVVGMGISTRRKAPDLFVEVGAQAIRREGRIRPVWIGGEADPLFEPVRSWAHLLAPDRIEVRPGVADPAPWLAAADVLCHPARGDSFPLVCLEAASLGTPVVAFAGVGGVPEMLGPTFLGAPYPDTDALAGHLVALSDPAHRREVAAAQGERVHGRYISDEPPRMVREVLVATAGVRNG